MALRNVILIQLRNPVGKEEPLPVLRVYDDIRMLRLKRAFFEDTLSQVAPIEDAAIMVAVAPPDRKTWVRDAVHHLAQRYADRRAFRDLAERTSTIGQTVAPIQQRTSENLKRCLAEGYKNIILMGGYLPTIRTEMIVEAIKHLARHPIILGPTIEGGCYLVGLRSDCPEAAGMISIGLDTSYRDSTDALTAARMSWQEIDLSYDVSHEEDLEFIVREINHARFTGDEDMGLSTEAVLAEFMNESPTRTARPPQGHRSAAGD